jgi:prepilin-type processing-associated H-X9-DG protein
MILPHIEQQALSSTFSLKDYISADINREPRGQVIATMMCPTDSAYNTQPFAVPATLGGDNWARGNYGANSSLAHMQKDNVAYSAAHSDSAPIWFGSGWAGHLGWTRGVMGGNTSLSIEQIADGTSNTVLLVELRAGLSPGDRRGIWAMGAAGASSVWAYSTDDCLGPNYCGDNADNIMSSNRAVAEVGADVLLQQCMGVSSGGSTSNQAAPRSQHPGGVTVGFADGSVTFISDNIEVHHGPDRDIAYRADGFTLFGAWEKIMCSSDGGTFNRNEF